MNINILVQLSDPGDRPEQLEASVEDFCLDLVRLGAVTVSRPGDPHPPGARGGDLVTIGAVLVALARSPDLLRAVVSVVDTWLGGRRQGGVELEVDGEKLVLTGAHRRDQQKVMEAFIDRHSRVAQDDTTP